MITIKLEHEKPLSIMNIVAEMRECGFRQSFDFDFSYHPADEVNNELVPRHTIFTFYDENIASWFVLRYIKS